MEKNNFDTPLLLISKGVLDFMKPKQKKDPISEPEKEPLTMGGEPTDAAYALQDKMDEFDKKLKRVRDNPTPEEMGYAPKVTKVAPKVPLKEDVTAPSKTPISIHKPQGEVIPLVPPKVSEKTERKKLIQQEVEKRVPKIKEPKDTGAEIPEERESAPKSYGAFVPDEDEDDDTLAQKETIKRKLEPEAPETPDELADVYPGTNKPVDPFKFKEKNLYVKTLVDKIKALEKRKGGGNSEGYELDTSSLSPMDKRALKEHEGEINRALNPEEAEENVEKPKQIEAKESDALIAQRNRTLADVDKKIKALKSSHFKISEVPHTWKVPILRGGEVMRGKDGKVMYSTRVMPDTEVQTITDGLIKRNPDIPEEDLQLTSMPLEIYEAETARAAEQFEEDKKNKMQELLSQRKGRPYGITAQDIKNQQDVTRNLPEPPSKWEQYRVEQYPLESARREGQPLYLKHRPSGHVAEIRELADGRFEIEITSNGKDVTNPEEDNVFSRERGALNKIKEYFEALDSQYPSDKEPNLNNIIDELSKKIETLRDKYGNVPEESIPPEEDKELRGLERQLDDATAKRDAYRRYIGKSMDLNKAIDVDFFGEYKSGDNTLKLEHKDDKYNVIANGSVIFETDEPRRAIARFYRSISNLIDANTEDKDVALDLLGDQIILNNRQAIGKLSMLGKSEEAEELKGFNLAYISFPFDEEVFLKDSQFRKLVPSSMLGGEPILGDSNENYEVGAEGDKTDRSKEALRRAGQKFKRAIVLKAQTLGMTPKMDNDYQDVVTRELNKPSKITKETAQTMIHPIQLIEQKMTEPEHISEGGSAQENLGFSLYGGNKQKPIKAKEIWK